MLKILNHQNNIEDRQTISFSSLIWCERALALPPNKSNFAITKSLIKLPLEDVVLLHNADFSTETVNSFNNSAELFKLSPSEYLVWHGLVVACSHHDGSMNHYYAASIADVARAIRIQRETVRRALLNLEQYQLARRINDRWIFQSLDD